MCLLCRRSHLFSCPQRAPFSLRVQPSGCVGAEPSRWAQCSLSSHSCPSSAEPLWRMAALCVHLHKPEIRMPPLTPPSPHPQEVIRCGWIFFTPSPASFYSYPSLFSTHLLEQRATCLNHTSSPVIPLTNSLLWSSLPAR